MSPTDPVRDNIFIMGVGQVQERVFHKVILYIKKYSSLAKEEKYLK